MKKKKNKKLSIVQSDSRIEEGKEGKEASLRSSGMIWLGKRS